MRIYKGLSIRLYVGLVIFFISVAVYFPLLALLGSTNHQYQQNLHQDVAASTIEGALVGIGAQFTTKATRDFSKIESLLFSLENVSRFSILDEERKPVFFGENQSLPVTTVAEVTVNEYPVESHGSTGGYLLISFSSQEPSWPLISLGAGLLAMVFGLLTYLMFLVAFRKVENAFSLFVQAATSLSKGNSNVVFENHSVLKELDGLVNSFCNISGELDRTWALLDKEQLKNEKKNKTLQVVARELSSPLRALIKHLDIAVGQSQAGQQNDVLNSLKCCVLDSRSMDHKLDSILFLSEYDKCALKPNKDWVGMSSLFKDVDRQYRMVCETRENISWMATFPFADAHQVIHTDVRLIRLIVRSALDNAVKYTNQGFIKFSFSRIDDSLEIEVCDSGVGFSESDLQLLGSPNTNQPSWGVGLNTIHKLVTFLGGKVVYSSKSGFGTKVNISIPVTYKQAPMAIEYDTNSDFDSKDMTKQFDHFIASRIDGNRLVTGLDILVVSESLVDRAGVERVISGSVLSSQITSFQFCSEPNKAIMAIEEKAFDMVLIDSKFPGMDCNAFLNFIIAGGVASCNALRVSLVIESAEKQNYSELSRLSDFVFIGHKSSKTRKRKSKRQRLKAVE